MCSYVLLILEVYFPLHFGRKKHDAKKFFDVIKLLVLQPLSSFGKVPLSFSFGFKKCHIRLPFWKVYKIIFTCILHQIFIITIFLFYPIPPPPLPLDERTVQ